MEIIASVKVELDWYRDRRCMNIQIRFINPLKRRFIPLGLRQRFCEIFDVSLFPQRLLGEEEIVYKVGQNYKEAKSKFFDRVAEYLQTEHLNKIVEEEILNYMGDYMEKHQLDSIMKQINQGYRVIVTVKKEKEQDEYSQN
ncbi:hypothetical protein [Bacillus wiedmannii]|uniref:hypothetical protein n=1 Tax=Bacillus wiedmannii TaxID=1890302 RepID=UPI003D1A8531